MLEKALALPASLSTPDGKRLRWVAYLFLILLCFAFFTPGFVMMPSTDRDESAFAQASKQMIESGNYTDIRLQAVPRYKKPIGIYWLQSTAVRLLNPHHLNEIWAYRVPSFIGATAAVVMTAALGSLLFSPEVGLLAAMMLAGCVLLNVEARLAKTDAVLLACIVSAMYGLARAYLGQVSGLKVPLAFWTAVAFGILVKGPILLLPVCGVLLWLKRSDKNLAWFKALRPALGLPFALTLIAPWFIAITMQSHGAFLQQSAGQDMFAKLWQGQNRGMVMPGMHLLIFPVVFFPFALYALLAFPDIWKSRKETAVKFCLGWLVPTWIVFEMSLTKLPHYVLPAYPAIALLAAKFLLDGFPTIAASTKRFSIVLIVATWIMIGASFAVVFALLPNYTDNIWSVPQIAAGLVLVVAQCFALFLLPHKPTASLGALLIGSMLFISTVFGVTIPRLQHVWLSREIVEAVTPIKPCPQSQLIVTGYHEPSLVFLAGTDTILANSGIDAAKALLQDPCRVAAIDNFYKQDFLDNFAKPNRQPREVGVIKGLNSGHGAEAALTLYVLPQETK